MHDLRYTITAAHVHKTLPVYLKMGYNVFYFCFVCQGGQDILSMMGQLMKPKKTEITGRKYSNQCMWNRYHVFPVNSSYFNKSLLLCVCR